jgi:hypothetical protein
MSRRIYAERFVCFGPAEMNRFALIPPLRALAGAPVGMTKKGLPCEKLSLLPISPLQATNILGLRSVHWLKPVALEPHP